MMYETPFILSNRERANQSSTSRAGPVSMMPYWSTMSRSGTLGDPTKATKEKGEMWLTAAIEGLVGIIQEFKKLGIRERVDHH
jgi:creatinine amidohydrolase